MVPSLLDRYVVRETLLPFFLSLLLITFLLIIPPLLQQGYTLIAQGVGWSVVVRVLVTLLPQALSISIPMAVLHGPARSRSAGCRPTASSWRCRRAASASTGCSARWPSSRSSSTAATAYVLIVVAAERQPDGSGKSRCGEVSSLVENNVKPRVFFDKFPNRVLYVRDLPPGGGWRDIFLADSSKPGETTVYFARKAGSSSIARSRWCSCS